MKDDKDIYIRRRTSWGAYRIYKIINDNGDMIRVH